MENRLIVTRADERVNKVIELTHPILKKYAKKCNAEFMILDGNEPPPLHHYRILKFYNLLDDFDRIMHLDSDVIIKNNCLDLFSEVPEDCIGTIYEDRGSRQGYRRSLIKAIQEEREDVGWTEGYINTGVFIVSKEHKAIFDPDMYENLWMDFGQDDVELGFRIHKLNMKIYELDTKFNHMSMFSEKWNNYKSRFDSYILHYAGNGFFPNIPQHRQIKEDLVILKSFGEV